MSSGTYRNAPLSPSTTQFRPGASGKNPRRGTTATGGQNGWYLIYGLILVMILFVGMTYYTHSVLTSNHEEALSLNNNAFVVNNLHIPVTMREVEVSLEFSHIPFPVVDDLTDSLSLSCLNILAFLSLSVTLSLHLLSLSLSLSISLSISLSLFLSLPV
jgi:hypothetical protein